jgi:NhaP-type Na+/H+ or K+/H+ antiporter
MLEFAGIIILGIMAQWFAWKLKIPAILPLIIIGLLVGPVSTYFTPNGQKLIEPVWNGSNGLFPGEMMFHFVSLAISLILFEGGMTLKKDEIKKIGPVIYRLITLGALVTFITAAVAAHYIMGLNWKISFLFSSLIIVTGPTVISPILRNLSVKKEISTILKWEGILIDPIGALVAVLVFEFIHIETTHDMTFTLEVFVEMMKIIIIGTSIGFSFAFAFAQALKNKWIPHYLVNVVGLSWVLAVYVISDLFAKESGLLAVVIMGMVLGNMKIKELDHLLDFKESISILLISLLFILLSANINISDLMLLYDWHTVVLFLVIILLIRPLSVWLSSRNSSLSLNDKAFISWVGPRGIVAAGIASLFGIKLMAKGVEQAEYIVPLVFMIVLGTVLLNATTAGLFARITRVLLQKSTGILIVGASPVSRLIAQYFQKQGRRVVLIDSNTLAIQKAKEMGLEAHEADIFHDDLSEHIEWSDLGILLAFTGSNRVNKHALDKLRAYFGEEGYYRLISAEELHQLPEDTQHIFSTRDDYINLSEIVRDYPNIQETEIRDKEHLIQLLDQLYQNLHTAPLLITDTTGEFYTVEEALKKELSPGSKLIYIGQEIPSLQVKNKA